ncbi:hypothetical protein Cgig2_004404 [Carnegiea gigantea]|uniref:BHLH domain-containing protein n=1 Tax=Carnegiea gigantea TaxID=171969 RepID=A0A9Q1JRX5_9CARY|nr:hypothetical protein Cgig2_004404 [Carnegiea gigantea]
MESTNLQEEEYHHHHHHHQEQQLRDELVVGSSNSSLASPCFSVGTNHHAWRPPGFLLNNNNVHANCEEAAATTNSLTNSLIQNMDFGWANPSIHDDQQSLISNKSIKQLSSSSTSDHHNPHHNNSASSSAFPTDMLSPSASPSELLLLNTLSPNYKHPMLANGEFLQLSAIHQAGNKGVTTNFSQIFPSVNISDLGSNNNNNNNNSISELISSSSATEMAHDLQGNLDVYATARQLSEGNLISHGVDSSNNHLLELFKFEHHHLEQQSSDLKLWNSANNVRKEKLGDRIAALQQLVAPFGKTDTASVLMEAIGYIKFLQNQVETLSVPYMRLSSHNKLSTNNTQRVSEGPCDSEEHKPDLKSRGLCLVPISCMTYLTSDACSGGLWPPPNFHPGF